MSDHSPPPHPLIAWFTSHYVILVLIGVTAFSLIYQGIYFGLAVSDHSLYVPLIKFLNNPQLFPHDIMVQTAPYFFTYFLKFFAFSVSFFNLETQFFIFQVICRFAWIGAIYYLARTFSLDRNAALLAALFLALGKVFFNFSSLANGFVPSALSWPLLLFSLAFFWQERFPATAILAAIAFNFHSLMTIYLLIIMLVMLISQIIIEGKRPDLKVVMLSIAIFLILALPTIVWITQSLQATSYHPESWASLNLVRYKHFTSPASWGIENYLGAAILVLLFLLGCLSRPTNKTVLWFAFGGSTIILTLIGLPFFAFQKIPFMLKAQFIRAFLFLYFPALLLMAGWLYENFRHYEGIAIRFLIYLTGLGLVFYGPNNFLTNLICFSIGLLPLLLVLNYFEKKSLYLVIFGCGVMITFVGFFTAAFNVDYVLIGSILSAAIILSLLDYFRDNRFANVICIAILLLLAGGMTANSIVKIRNKNQPLKYWQDVQLWAQQNTPVDSVFITPPAINGWHIHSERSNVLDWKSIVTIYCAPKTSDEWVKRLADFGYDLKADADKDLRTALHDAYLGFTPARFESLAKKYKADYVVTVYPQPPLPFQLLFGNSTYRIYQL